MTDTDRHQRDPSTEPSQQDDPAGSATKAWSNRGISILRIVALSLLILGFSGWLLDDGGEIALESPFTIAFAAGVGCTVVSIYLGIFLADGGG